MMRRKCSICLALFLLVATVLCSDSPEPRPKLSVKPDDPASDRGIVAAPYPDTVTITVGNRGSGEEGESEGDDAESEAESEGSEAAVRGVKAVSPTTQIDLVIGSVADSKSVIPPPDPDPHYATAPAPLVIVGEQLQAYPGQLQIQHAPAAGPRVFPYHQKPSYTRKAGKLVAPYVELPSAKPHPENWLYASLENTPSYEKTNPTKKPVYEAPITDPPTSAPRAPQVIQTVHIVQGSAPVPAILVHPNYSNSVYNTVNRNTNFVQQLHSSTIYNAPPIYPAPQVSVMTKVRALQSHHPNALSALFPVYSKKSYLNPSYRVANAHSPLPLGALVPSPPGILEQPLVEFPPRYPSPIEHVVEKPAPVEAPRYYPQQPANAHPSEITNPPPTPPIPVTYPETVYPKPVPTLSTSPIIYQTSANRNLLPPYDPSSMPPPHNNMPTNNPLCARETGLRYCLVDPEYPTAEINAYMAMYPEKYQLLRPMVPWTVIPEQSSAGNPYSHTVSTAPQPANLDQNLATQSPDTCQSHSLPSAKVLRATNTQDKWKVIIHLPDAIQTCNLGTCDKNRTCRFVDHLIPTQCVQEYILQQLMVYSPEFGVHVDDMKIPQGCKCRILNKTPLRRHPH